MQTPPLSGFRTFSSPQRQLLAHWERLPRPSPVPEIFEIGFLSWLSLETESHDGRVVLGDCPTVNVLTADPRSGVCRHLTPFFYGQVPCTALGLLPHPLMDVRAAPPCGCGDTAVNLHVQVFM